MTRRTSMRFEFGTAARIVFGPGTLREAGQAAKAMGKHALVVTGRNTRRAAPLIAALREQAVVALCFPVAGEPDLDSIRRGIALARGEGCDLIIGMGGGSALDAGKAIAAILGNPGDVLDYVEIIGRGQLLNRPSLPFIAIPTTAGTGAEVTRNAVLASPEHRVKVSLRSPGMLPKLALVDPELTRGLPPDVTSRTGLDALTQLIEAYACSRANPMVDALCRDGLRRVARSLRVVCANGQDAVGRQDMALAALYSGLALANAGLGAVHGLAGPLGGMFPAPHGALCATLLPVTIAINLRALRQRQPASPALARYEEIARLLTGNPAAAADDGIVWLRELVADLNIPRLAHYGFAAEHTAELISKAANASSMKANPIALTPKELGEILALS